MVEERRADTRYSVGAPVTQLTLALVYVATGALPDRLARTAIVKLEMRTILSNWDNPVDPTDP